MSERVVLITGANGGLGTSVTEAFLQTGDRVIGASRKITSSDFPKSKFERAQGDFTQLPVIRETVSKIIAKYGRLDVLVHVLGGFAGGTPISETSDATWEQMRDLNLTAAFYFMRETIPHLRKAPNGRTIAIGSLTAREPHANLGAYVVFKNALSMLVQTVAAESAETRLTANVILPGTMDTAANRKAMPDADFAKWLPPKNVAELAVWLAEESAGNVNGATLAIDGPHA